MPLFVNLKFTHFFFTIKYTADNEEVNVVSQIYLKSLWDYSHIETLLGTFYSTTSKHPLVHSVLITLFNSDVNAYAVDTKEFIENGGFFPEVFHIN